MPDGRGDDSDRSCVYFSRVLNRFYHDALTDQVRTVLWGNLGPQHVLFSIFGSAWEYTCKSQTLAWSYSTAQVFR